MPADDGGMVYLTCARVAGSAATRSLPAFRLAGRAGRLASRAVRRGRRGGRPPRAGHRPRLRRLRRPGAAPGGRRGLAARAAGDRQEVLHRRVPAGRAVPLRDAPGQRRGAGRILRLERPAVHLDQVRGGTGPGAPETGHPGPAPAGRRAGRWPAGRDHQRVLDGRLGDRHQRVPRPRPAGAAQVDRAGAGQGAVRPRPARPGLHVPDHRVPAVPARAAGAGR